MMPVRIHICRQVGKVLGRLSVQDAIGGGAVQGGDGAIFPAGSFFEKHCFIGPCTVRVQMYRYIGVCYPDGSGAFAPYPNDY